MKVLLVVGLFVALAGCGSKNAECSLEARAGVNVFLTDAVTKKPRPSTIGNSWP